MNAGAYIIQNTEYRIPQFDIFNGLKRLPGLKSCLCDTPTRTSAAAQCGSGYHTHGETTRQSYTIIVILVILRNIAL